MHCKDYKASDFNRRYYSKKYRHELLMQKLWVIALVLGLLLAFVFVGNIERGF